MYDGEESNQNQLQEIRTPDDNVRSELLQLLQRDGQVLVVGVLWDFDSSNVCHCEVLDQVVERVAHGVRVCRVFVQVADRFRASQTERSHDQRQQLLGRRFHAEHVLPALVDGRRRGAAADHQHLVRFAVSTIKPDVSQRFCTKQMPATKQHHKPDVSRGSSERAAVRPGHHIRLVHVRLVVRDRHGRIREVVIDPEVDAAGALVVLADDDLHAAVRVVDPLRPQRDRVSDRGALVRVRVARGQRGRSAHHDGAVEAPLVRLVKQFQAEACVHESQQTEQESRVFRSHLARCKEARDSWAGSQQRKRQSKSGKRAEARDGWPITTQEKIACDRCDARFCFLSARLTR
jgi:hypothetical protein